MNQQISGLRVAGGIFSIVALAQLLRLLTRVEIVIAGHVLPLWPNAVALVIAGALSFWMFRLSSRGGK